MDTYHFIKREDLKKLLESVIYINNIMQDCLINKQDYDATVLYCKEELDENSKFYTKIYKEVIEYKGEVKKKNK